MKRRKRKPNKKVYKVTITGDQNPASISKTHTPNMYFVYIGDHKQKTSNEDIKRVLNFIRNETKVSQISDDLVALFIINDEPIEFMKERLSTICQSEPKTNSPSKPNQVIAIQYSIQQKTKTLVLYGKHRIEKQIENSIKLCASIFQMIRDIKNEHDKGSPIYQEEETVKFLIKNKFSLQAREAITNQLCEAITSQSNKTESIYLESQKHKHQITKTENI